MTTDNTDIPPNRPSHLKMRVALALTLTIAPLMLATCTDSAGWHLARAGTSTFVD